MRHSKALNFCYILQKALKFSYLLWFSGEKEKHVYFAGQRTHPCNSNYYIRSGSVLTFNDVVTNQGNGFNGGAGIFKALVSGVYLFTFIFLGYEVEEFAQFATC